MRLAVSFNGAVSSTIHGFLPPNSRVTGVRNFEAASYTIGPTLGLPVKNI